MCIIFDSICVGENISTGPRLSVLKVIAFKSCQKIARGHIVIKKAINANVLLTL